jgi:outer membrane protein assembly factor BamB
MASRFAILLAASLCVARAREQHSAPFGQLIDPEDPLDQLPKSAQWSVPLYDSLSYGPVTWDGLVAVTTLTSNALLGFELQSGSLRWNYSGNPYCGDMSSISFSTAGLFVASRYCVERVDPSLGVAQWSTQHTVGRQLYFVDALVASSSGRVFFVSVQDALFFALEARTGAVLWKRPIPGYYGSDFFSAPVPFGADLLVYYSEDKALNVWNAVNGTTRWSTPVAVHQGSPSVAVDSATGAVFMGDFSGTVRGWRIEDGGVIWERSFDTSFGDGGIAAEDGVVVVPIFFADAGSLAALSAANGAPQWHVNNTDWCKMPCALRRGDDMFFINSTFTGTALTRLHLATGTVVWSADAPGACGSFSSFDVSSDACWATWGSWDAKTGVDALEARSLCT